MSASPQLTESDMKRRPKSVLAQWADLAACDACHARKVKCIRLDNKTEECEACIFRTDVCTNLRVKPSRQRQNRTSKKVAPYLQRQREVAHISHQSPETCLQRIELTEVFMADLLASFFEHSDEQAPYANFGRVQLEFEQAGRRLNQLAPLSEILVLAMISSSAQYSDSPILLGANAPRLGELTTIHNDTELTQYGLRRKALCEYLVQKVIRLTDSRGLLRKASSTSISILMMLPRVLRHPSPVKWQGLEDIGDKWRPFVSAALEHVRTLFAMEGAKNVDIGSIQWPMLFGDATHSAFSGCNLLVTDEDLAEFPYMTGIPPLSAELVRMFIASKSINEFLLPCVAFGNLVVNVARKIARTISIPLAKQRSVEIETFAERIEELRDCLAKLGECKMVAEELEPTIPIATLTLQKKIIGASVATHLRYAIVTPALLMPALHKQFAIYKLQQTSLAWLDSIDHKDILRWQQVEAQLQIGCIEALLIVTKIIRGLEGSELVASLTKQTSLLVSVQDSVLRYINLALETPAFEDTGPSWLWTREIKLQSLRLLIDAARLQAWAWSDREADVNLCESFYERYADSISRSPPPSNPIVTSVVPILAHSTPATSLPPLSDLKPEPVAFAELTASDLTFITESVGDWGNDYTDLWNAHSADTNNSCLESLTQIQAIK